MKISRKICGWKGCKKSYAYTAWLSKHIDKEHPEIAREPVDLLAMFYNPKALKAMNEEAKSFIKLDRLVGSWK